MMHLFGVKVMPAWKPPGSARMSGRRSTLVIVTVSLLLWAVIVAVVLAIVPGMP